MKRRILMVSAMILLLGSQMQMYAQKKGGPEDRRPGMEMHAGKKPGGPMIKKAICQSDILRVQEMYWEKYRIRLSKKEAEKILLSERREWHRGDFAQMPQPPKRKRPAFTSPHMGPKGPQRPH